MATNEYGLDVSYFEKNLKQIIRDIKCYTPGEMERALFRLSEVAKVEEIKKRGNQ